MKKINLLDNEYEIIKDDNQVFDYEETKSLMTDYFADYDYVLGDYAYGKLRLKGFYKDNNKKANNINKYSYMDKYIKDYCAYMCKYFIIEKNTKNIDK